MNTPDFAAAYARMLEVTGCRTQDDLAKYFGIRQSSISDAKRRGAVPSDWRLALLEKKSINELREAKAEAEKRIAATEGNAKAKIAEAEGEAKSLLLRAEAQAKANDILARSLTSELLHYNTIQSWDGKLPQVNGGAMPLLQLPVSTLKEN